MSFKKVPTVDVRAYIDGSVTDQNHFVRVFGSAIQELGFVIVEGHGISQELILSGYAQAQSFFNLSLTEKMNYKVGQGGQRGYTPFGSESAKGNPHRDLKEFWHVGRDTFQNPHTQNLYPSNVWPDKNLLPKFKHVFQTLYQTLDAFSGVLLQALDRYMQLPTDTLASMGCDGNSILRVLHYPPMTPEQTSGPSVRAAAHEDINLITILCEATEPGLQLLTHDGHWLDVESGPGQVVVDSGDMLSRVTNGIIPSTTHRVLNPTDAPSLAKSRYSMPFFVHPYNTCRLDVLPQCLSDQRPIQFPPISAEEYLSQRLKELGLL